MAIDLSQVPDDQLDIDHLVLLSYERKRRASASVPQPQIPVTVDAAQVLSYFRRPADAGDEGLVAFDVLCQAVGDAIDAGNMPDAFFGALRLVRKMWTYQPHLGPVERFQPPTTTP